MNILKAAAAASLVVCLGACATAAAPVGASFRAASSNASILLMEPNVSVIFVTTGGSEPRADWTEQAKTNLTEALVSQLQASGERVTVYDAANETPEVQQALLLQEAVTDALAAHVVFIGPGFMGQLPHQRTQPETYSLADTVGVLAPNAEADYAMFLTSRAQIESGGLFMTKVLIGAATGYTPASADFRGTYISLVDLRTGEVVWLDSALMGDPRDPAEAATIISQILEGGPFDETAQ